MDVCSGAIHVVDDVTYDVIALYEEKSLEEIENELSYSKEDIEEAYKEVTSLKEEGLLFTEDIYEDYIKEVKSRKTVVKALCLHIAHDCNLACRYCFSSRERPYSTTSFTTPKFIVGSPPKKSTSRL